jgi:hypothetical protein
MKWALSHARGSFGFTAIKIGRSRQVQVGLDLSSNRAPLRSNQALSIRALYNADFEMSQNCISAPFKPRAPRLLLEKLGSTSATGDAHRQMSLSVL